MINDRNNDNDQKYICHRPCAGPHSKCWCPRVDRVTRLSNKLLFRDPVLGNAKSSALTMPLSLSSRTRHKNKTKNLLIRNPFKNTSVN